jgi:serine/threonine protein kinase
LRTLHEVSLGIQQLHGIGIAHKDIKPSNVLFFSSTGAKLADLGRASQKGSNGPHDSLKVACQGRYAPLDHIYGFPQTSWEEKHLAADLYHLGGYAFFLFMNVPITPAILLRVPQEFRPDIFVGPYGDAIPVLRYALSDVLPELANKTPPIIAEQLAETIKLLCDPDPSRRGHPAEHAERYGSKYAIRRFLSSFDTMKRSLQRSL